jgi:hypothetical protein
VASFSFDALSSLAWLDTVVEARGAGMLCQYHAERLTPPRGWSLLDRRNPDAKLFVERAPKEGTGRRPKRPRASRPRHAAPAVEPGVSEAPSADEPALPFDSAPGPTVPRTWSPRDLPALDENLDERTPLLAKAFESLRQAEADRGTPARDPGASGNAS